MTRLTHATSCIACDWLKDGPGQLSHARVPCCHIAEMGKGGEQKEGGMRRNDSATDMSDADLDDKASAAARYKVWRPTAMRAIVAPPAL